MVEERGGYLIVIARLHPSRPHGGDVHLRQPGLGVAPLHPCDVLAGVIWGFYAALLGYFGGKTFKDSPFKGFLVAFAVALAITGDVEVVRWIRKRERRTPEASPPRSA